MTAQAPHKTPVKALTKTTCKRVIGALQAMQVDQYEIVVEGNALRIIVGKEIDDGADMGNLIDGVM